jgi:hypothetical protein
MKLLIIALPGLSKKPVTPGPETCLDFEEYQLQFSDNVATHAIEAGPGTV